jgi:hypothetical protein
MQQAPEHDRVAVDYWKAPYDAVINSTSWQTFKLSESYLTPGSLVRQVVAPPSRKLP